MDARKALEFFGFGNDDINAFFALENTFDTAREVALLFGNEKDKIKENEVFGFYKWSEKVVEGLKREGNYCASKVMLGVTLEMLQSSPTLTALGIEFEEKNSAYDKGKNVIGYHLGGSKKYDDEFSYRGSEFFDDFCGAFAEKMLPAIEQYLGNDNSLSAEDVEDILKSGELTVNEVMLCVNNGEITGSLKEQIDEIAIDNRQEKISVEK